MAEPITPESLRRDLETTEWPRVTLIQGAPAEEGAEPESLMSMRVCPYCASPVFDDQDGFPFRQWHIDSHVDTIRLIYAAEDGTL